MQRELLQKPFLYAGGSGRLSIILMLLTRFFDNKEWYISCERTERMIFVIHGENPQQRLIQKACDILNEGGIIIYPTDTVYAYGCDIKDKHAIERIYRIKKIDKKKPLSFVFSDISSINDYVRNISNDAFKIMKKALPGPYTFIFSAQSLCRG